MTYEEYYYYSNGYFIRQAREWERTRMVTWLIYNANSDPKHHKKRPEDLFPLITDDASCKEDKLTTAIDYAEKMRKAKEFAENVLNKRNES